MSKVCSRVLEVLLRRVLELTEGGRAERIV